MMLIDYVIYLASRELDVARGGDKLYPRVFSSHQCRADSEKFVGIH